MGRGRAKGALSACVAAVVALLAAGCGAETHPNEPRPQVALQVSVSIGPDEIVVQPAQIGVGPARTQQIPQNQNHAQPAIRAKAPATVRIVASNRTGTDTRLELRGPRSASSEPIPANSPGTLQADLPTGTYVIAAAGVPSARVGKLVVGPYRASSENDVLLP
jgi:hypothetical protein